MQFILEQQTQTAVNHTKAEERMKRIEEAQENTARQIERLSGALIELTEAHARTQVALTRLAEAQAHSDQRLDALIDVVRDGKRKGQ